MTAHKLKSIFTSLPVWACIAAHFAHTWGFYLFVNGLPTYLSTVLKVTPLMAGIAVCIPYFLTWIAMVSAGTLADYWIRKEFMTRTNVRKFFNITGLIGSGLFGILAGFCQCDVYAAMFCVSLSLCFGGITWAGWSVNHLDLAPAYAGTLMGITNTFATICGFVSGGVVTGMIHQSEPTQFAWRRVFYTAMGVDVLFSIFVFFFLSGEQQPWATPEYH